MNLINLLLANSIFLFLILILLISLLLTKFNSKSKLKEDIQKIKTQISSE